MSPWPRIELIDTANGHVLGYHRYDHMTIATATNEKLLELTRIHEKEIHKHRQHVTMLSRAINSRLPAFSLPDELLVEVSFYYRDSHTLVEESGNTGQTKLDPTRWWWLVPTHICHRWRLVAHATPMLWCHLDTDVFSRPHFLEATLQRSRQLPLDISVMYGLFGADTMTPEDYWNEDEKRNLGSILKESHRIRKLHLKMPQYLVKSQVNKGTTLRPFTQLEDLHIHPLTPLSGGILMSPILRKLTCSLRNLTLAGVIIRWETMKHLPPSLTNLDITFPVSHPFGTPANILNALARLSRLECLCLYTLPIRSRSRQPLKAVDLPHLKELNLSQTTSWHVLSIVQALSFPPNIDATIRITFSYNDILNFPVPISSVFTKFNLSTLPLSNGEESSIYTSLTYNPGTHGLSFETSTEACRGSWPRYFNFTIMLSDKNVQDFDLSPWVDFVEAVSLTVYPVITDITIEGLYKILSKRSFAATLLQARNLKRIQVNHGTVVKHLGAALRVLSDGTVPVSNLEAVTVRSGYPWTTYRGQVDGQQLCKFLRGRSEMGYRLQEFRIHDSKNFHPTCPETWVELDGLVKLVLID